MVQEQDEVLSLVNLMEGLAVERFDDELAGVLANIVDPNTPAAAKREITLKLSIKPNKDRGIGAMEIAVSSKLAAPEKMGTVVFISMTRNGPVATEHNPRQPRLDFSGEEKIEQAVTAAVQQLRPVTGGKA